MRVFTKMHGHMTYTFHLENTTLPMLASLIVMSFLFHIEACAITLPNGAVQIRGKSTTCSAKQSTDLRLSSVLDLKISKSFLIFDTLQPGMSSSAFLVF
jgi:hypothetical protein